MPRFLVGIALTVACALVAGSAAYAAPGGAGPIAGVIDYDGGGPPPPGHPCTGVTFDIEATSLTASVGSLSVTGTGGGFCDSALLGGGNVWLSIKFVALDGTAYDCPTTVGSYLRTAYQLNLLVPAQCTVGAYGTAHLIVTIRAALVPDTPYGWFVGAFAVAPA